MSMLPIALVLGVIEGLTEFLPISSTGHLVLASHLMGFTGKRAEVFEVFIQLGAILAIVWEYRKRLLGIARDATRDARARSFARNLFWAFLPCAILGLAVHHYVSDLFRPVPVALALVAGALAILVVEVLPLRFRIHAVDEVRWGQALLVGLAQCFALWPGFSRSAATILGGLLVGMDRRTATEFSFFLAIPTMLAATFYDLAVHHAWLEEGDLGWIALALGTSFAVALVSIRWLLRFVSSHSFRPFAWYRLALAGAVLALLYRNGF